MHVITVTRRTVARPEDVWALWADVPNRTRWDDSLERATIDGPFRSGATGVVKLKGQPERRFEVVRSVPPHAYTDRFFLPMAGKMDWNHSIREVDGEQEVTFDVSVSGPMSLILGLIIRRILRRELPPTVDRLVALAEAGTGSTAELGGHGRREEEEAMQGERGTHEVVVTRRLEAPPERVWRAWSDPDEVKGWWGPQGFTSPMCRMDFREGGTTLVSMRSDQGWEVYNTWTYHSIHPTSRIEFVQRFADADGNAVAPVELGMPPGIPGEVRHVVTLTPVGETATELTVHEFGYADEPTAEISKAGMEQCIDKMAARLGTD
jgi:uncharacterized protein YndB with AHSA1/START domain